jgi:pimeloyl-ACP methyl ester carboxylesterase
MPDDTPNPDPTTRPLPENARWEETGDSGPALHFYHANGMPLKAYGPLLSLLGLKHDVKALHGRATWPGMSGPPGKRSWQIYVDDLISFIEHQHDAPVIGVGHSMGGACTVMAAAQRPDLFRALVLIEPAMVSRGLAMMTRLMPKIAMSRFQPVKGTLRKTDNWASRQDFMVFIRKFHGYQRFSEEAYRDLAEHGVVEKEDGRFHLTYSKHWEAHAYSTPPYLMRHMAGLPMPIVGIRGKPSFFFADSLWHSWQKHCPNAVFLEDSRFGHLMPLENPEACHELIEQGLDRVLPRQEK